MNNPNVRNSKKIFIGGLAGTTDQLRMRSYFEQYGEVKDCVLMVEKATGKSRGFGFVIMKNEIDVARIL